MRQYHKNRIIIFYKNTLQLKMAPRSIYILKWHIFCYILNVSHCSCMDLGLIKKEGKNTSIFELSSYLSIVLVDNNLVLIMLKLKLRVLISRSMSLSAVFVNGIITWLNRRTGGCDVDICYVYCMIKWLNDEVQNRRILLLICDCESYYFYSMQSEMSNFLSIDFCNLVSAICNCKCPAIWVVGGWNIKF